MKRIFLFLTILVAYSEAQSQPVKTDYFGQNPPADTPQKFAPGLISKDGRYQLMAAFSPDGKEFIFTVTNEHWSHFDLWDAKYDAGKWSEPKQMSFMPTEGGFGPVFAPGNHKLYFTAGDWAHHPSTIAYSTREGTHLTAPHSLDSPVNSKFNQWEFSMATDGTLVFTSDRQGGKGGYDLYLAEPVNGQYPTVTNIAELNSPEDEYSAYIAPDKSYIIFSSQRKGVYGWDDLFISFRQKNKTWTTPINLGPGINTINAEFAPQVSPDGKYLLYSQWDKHNKWSYIYWVRIDKTILRLKHQAGLE